MVQLKESALVIREGTPDDIPIIVAMGKELHEESPVFAGMSFSEDRMAFFLRSEFMAQAGCSFIAEEDGSPIGMFLGLIINPHHFSDDLIADELCYFIREEHRGGPSGLLLISAYEKWAWGRGAVLVTVEVSSGIRPERTLKLYERLGFQLQGYRVNKYRKGEE